MRAADNLAEADRLMTICNSCRYCEGLCAVFPAMEMRRVFSAGDLNYLANLCHSCGACYSACQFSPPHEFAVNVPKALAGLRGDSYRAYAWPRRFSIVFDRNGLFIAVAMASGVAAFVGGFMATAGPQIMFSAQAGPGAFYRVMPHVAMALLFGAVALYAILAIAMGMRAFSRSIGNPVIAPGRHRSLWQAIGDSCSLRYLDGGGVGCINEDERPTDRRRLFHHLTFYGFGLCFASTSVATLYHYLLGREAPYLWHELPVVLGAAGGLGLLIGPAGLFVARWRRDPALLDQSRTGMDVGFLAMLFLTGLTGMLLLALRGTSAMGVLLAVHLGVVFGLFVTMPYGKFVHGTYRFLALVRFAREKQVFASRRGRVV
jgi:citrate/tricarballylate utilization protein